MDETTQSGEWGIVELMGHKVVAGFVQKSEMLGKPMLRIDVPATRFASEFTQFYGEAAIYCVTFTSEEVAKRAAEAYKVNPVSVYVPDLVAKQALEEERRQHEKAIGRYRAMIDQMRGLPERSDLVDDEDNDREQAEESWESSS